jgi:hypothetical protein
MLRRLAFSLVIGLGLIGVVDIDFDIRRLL